LGALLRSLIFERITPIGRSSREFFFCAFILLVLANSPWWRRPPCLRAGTEADLRKKPQNWECCDVLLCCKLWKTFRIHLQHDCASGEFPAPFALPEVAVILHGSHQDAQKSVRTGTLVSRTIS
jgi:hypothetical protein